MAEKFDPIYNDQDRHTQHARDDTRRRIRSEAGGIDYVPEGDPYLPSSGAAAGPYTPSSDIRGEWRKIYARMSVDELRQEEDELYDEILELADLPYVDEHGHAMNEMKRDLIKERLAALDR